MFSDEEKSLVLEKAVQETDFGLHILDSEPAYITKVDPGLLLTVLIYFTVIFYLIKHISVISRYM